MKKLYVEAVLDGGRYAYGCGSEADSIERMEGRTAFLKSELQGSHRQNADLEN